MKALGGKGRRLPKRLRQAIPLFEEMINRASSCNFGRLLEAHCPLPDGFRNRKRRSSESQRGDVLSGSRVRENAAEGAPSNGVMGNPPTLTPRGDGEDEGIITPCPTNTGAASQESGVSDTSTEKDMLSGGGQQPARGSARCTARGVGERGGRFRGDEGTTRGQVEMAMVASPGLYASNDTVFDYSARSPSVVVNSVRSMDDDIDDGAGAGRGCGGVGGSPGDGRRTRDGADGGGVERTAKRRRLKSFENAAEETRLFSSEEVKFLAACVGAC